MKKLNVTMIYNPEYFGPKATPDVAEHVYKVVTVVNSVTPTIGLTLTTELLNEFCENDDWTVNIK